MASTTSDLTALYGSLSASEAAALDAAATAVGVTVADLMAIAGFQVARCAHAVAADLSVEQIIVVAGSGNNGGDGLVAARHLASWGWRVAVHVVAGREKWRLGHLAEPLAGLHIPVDVDESGTVAAKDLAQQSGGVLVVDALLGTGLTAAPRPAQAGVIAALAGIPVLSVDVPSGLDATTGRPLGGAVHALRTCTLAAMKSGLWTGAGREHAGAVWVADIGMPDAAWRNAGLQRPQRVTGGALVAVPE